MAPSDAAVKIIEDVGAPAADAAPSKKAPIATVSDEAAVKGPSGDTIVPITREYLRDLYAQYPDPVLSRELIDARAAVNAERARLKLSLSAVPTAPRRMDECMYSIRCECEESEISDLISTGVTFEAFQSAQRASVSAMVAQFLPADFRGWLFDVARQQSEAKNTAAVKALMAEPGASIRDKYALLWKQQWSRRETLSMVGNSTGIWKLAVKFIAGVPQALLDFARDINVPNGPTEELRCKFGPVLAQLTEMAAEINQLKHAVSINDSDSTDNDTVKAVECLDEGARLLRKESEQFCELLTKVVENSPFFVSREDIERHKAKTAAEKK